MIKVACDMHGVLLDIVTPYFEYGGMNALKCIENGKWKPGQYDIQKVVGVLWKNLPESFWALLRAT